MLGMTVVTGVKHLRLVMYSVCSFRKTAKYCEAGLMQKDQGNAYCIRSEDADSTEIWVSQILHTATQRWQVSCHSHVEEGAKEISLI